MELTDDAGVGWKQLRMDNDILGPKDAQHKAFLMEVWFRAPMDGLIGSRPNGIPCPE